MIKYFVCIILLVFSLTSQAKEIYYGSTPELVSISKETIFRFHKQVRTISQAHKFEIKPADPNDPDYSMLSVRPRFTQGLSKVAFVLSDGNVVTLKIRIIKDTNNSVEPFYDFRPKSMLVQRSEKNLPVITAMDFIKSIDKDNNVMGYQRQVRNKWLRTGHRRGVSARLIRTYKGKEYKGFVIELRNICKIKKYKVEVDRLKFRNSSSAIISLVDSEVLSPRGKGVYKTLLKVVAKPTALISDLTLPISVSNEKKEGEI